MNKHTKLAVLIAPFLAIGGYIATDYYDKHQVNKKRYHTLQVQTECNRNIGPCLLKGAGLTLEYTLKGELTNIEASYPLGSATIGIATEGDESKPFNLTPDSAMKNWTIKTSTYSADKTDSTQKIHLVVTAKEHVFFSEF